MLIHAAKGMTVEEYEMCLHLCRDIAKTRPFPPGTILPGPKQLQRGGIVGSVDIADCVQRSDSPWFQGKFGFVLRDQKILPFHPCRGQLGFFRLHGENIVR